MMPLLLEDLAEETSTSNRRTADRFDAETHELGNLPEALDGLHGLQERIVDSARHASDYAISRLPQAESLWRSALAMLPITSAEVSIDILRHLVDAFESGQRLARSPRSMWDLVERFGVSPERLEELGEAEKRFAQLAMHARRSLEHRTQAWQPADPERLALGLRMAREGKTVTADEARAWFRHPQN